MGATIPSLDFIDPPTLFILSEGSHVPQIFHFMPPSPALGPFSLRFAVSLGDALPSQLLGGPLTATAMATPGPRAARGEAVSSPLTGYLGPHSRGAVARVPGLWGTATSSIS